MKQKLSHPLALSGLLLLAGLLVTPGSAVATAPVGTPGPAGEVYLVRVGVASELLPNAPSDDDRLILALEILRPGEDPEWIEVPESEGVSANASHFALFEETSGTLFLVWQTRIGSHPVIKLASFRDGAWADVIPVSDNIWNFKGHPRLAVTRDTFTVEEDGETRSVERTFLHVVWWEDTLEGLRVLYRPLILEGGRLQGMGGVYALNDLVDLEADGSGTEPSRELLESPVLQPGRDSSSVVTGFVDARTGRLVVAEIRLLPMGLGKLGNETAEFITAYRSDTGKTETPDEVLRSLAGGVRSKILISGNRHRLNPRAVREIGDEVYEGLVGGSIAAPSSSTGKQPERQEELRSLADIVRSKILISGARIAGETLDRFNQAVAPSVVEMETEDGGSPGAQSGAAPHLVRMMLLSSAATPELGADAQASPSLFVSPDGTNVIVAWPEPSALAYRKTIAGSWSEVRRMSLSDELTLTDALEILRRSVRPVH